jgi:small-conductance mechanosensitive channel
MKTDFTFKVLLAAFCLMIFHWGTVAFAEEPAEAKAPRLSAPVSGSVNTVVPGNNMSEKADKKLPSVLEETRPNVRWSMSIGKLIWSVIVVLIAFYAIKYATRMLETIAERWVNLRLTVMRIIPFIRIMGWAGVIYFIVVAILSPPIETFLALTASAGIALGFASQDILKNIFGGLLILVDRPFQIGDKIQIREHYGEVVQIGLRSVRIVTPDDSIVSIPNSDIVSQSVSNSNNGESNCQVVAEVFVPFDTDLAKLKKTAIRAASVSRYIYLNKPIAVVFKNEIHEGRSMLKMRIKAYVLDIRYEFPFASDITELVIESLLKNRVVAPETPCNAHLPYSGSL